MRIKRIVFINRAPFRRLDLDLSDKQVISLTGINGAGKTTILSYVVDAFYEIARKAFPHEFKGIREGTLYRYSSNVYNISGASKSMVYISFDFDGKETHYIDLQGIDNENDFDQLMNEICEKKDPSVWPIKYSSISKQFAHGERFARYVSINVDDARHIFNNGLLTYFPSYRYEQPGYLNNVYRMELSYKNESSISGFLNNPIEVTSDLPRIANWIMDVILDKELYKQDEMLPKLQQLISVILSPKHKKSVRIGIGKRYRGGTRIQIVDAKTAETVYPTIFNISAGEASLLCIFGELLRQADNIWKKADEVEGIVLVDEVDKHLHLVFQNEVLPVLVQQFPKIQFVFSTHSAFVNVGLADKMNNSFCVFDLDNNGVECDPDNNEVFREVYDTMIEKNNQYAYFCDALNEKIESLTSPIVYLEGRTDEKYFKKALEVFEFDSSIVDFQWIGHLDDNGNEAFTGSSCLNQGMQFIKGRHSNVLQFFLFDSDTNRQQIDDNNIVVMKMPYFDEHTIMNKGIENTLELDDIDLEAFYVESIKEGDYGKVTKTKEFQKMKMCEYICGLDSESQKKILKNLKPIIENIINRIEQQKN